MIWLLPGLVVKVACDRTGLRVETSPEGSLSWANNKSPSGLFFLSRKRANLLALVMMQGFIKTELLTSFFISVVRENRTTEINVIRW